MKSPKEITVEQWLMRLTQELVDITPEVDDLPLHVIRDLINDTEIQAVQDFANKVSITRLGFNDHGPVHMRTVCPMPASPPASRGSRWARLTTASLQWLLPRSAMTLV